MLLLKRSERRGTPARRLSPAEVERLEGRVLFAHLGNVVNLPDAAEPGLGGLKQAITAPADHHRAKFVAGYIDPITF